MREKILKNKKGGIRKMSTIPYKEIREIIRENSYSIDDIVEKNLERVPREKIRELMNDDDYKGE
jgi:hypothetical protein